MLSPLARRNRNQSTRRGGFSVVEVLFVIAILALTAVAAVPLFQASLTDELENAAQVVAADLERARQLAITNNSKYKIVFWQNSPSYVLQHSGINAALNTLPYSPYRQSDDPADKQTTRLDQLPGMADISVIGAAKLVSTSKVAVTDIEFDPLGSTTRTEPSEIWLAAGKGDARRYISIVINPSTGLAGTGNIVGSPPAFVAPEAESSSGLSLELEAAGLSVGVSLGGSGGLLDINLGQSNDTGLNLGLGS